MRKVFMTGLLMFFQKGSLFQMVIAIFFSMVYGFYIAWCLPYRVSGANLVKVATECALLGTLTVSIMLKVDLSREDISEVAVGMLLAFNNIVFPVGGLCVALLSFGDQMMDELQAGMPSVPDFEFENPVQAGVEAEQDDGDAEAATQAYSDAKA